nr:SdrD B-like domain-containing protein [Meiothermus rufus]
MKRALALLLFSSLAFAQVVTPFAIRYQTNDRGAITLIANTLMCYPNATNTACDSAVMNNPAANNTILTSSNQLDTTRSMRFFNADASAPAWPTGRGGSSSATLSLPAGSQILFARLYWGARAGENAAGRNQISVKPPGSGSYQSISGTLLGTITTQGTNTSRPYTAFADLTSLVQAAGNGTYWVGGILAATGNDGLGFYAGWSLVVVYRDTAQSLRNLVVYDGLAVVSSGNPVTITPSGFLAPYFGSVNARVGAVAFEGDGGINGDQLLLNGSALSDGQNPANNFFNSSVSLLGTRFSSKTPDYINQMAVDADIVDATGRIPNGATSATLQFTSTQDVYFPTVLTFQIDLYVPDLITTFTKTVQDLNGGDVLLGDILEYTLSFTNIGLDGATNVVLTDPIPAHTQYVPGSLVVVSNAATAPTGSMSDTPGDDIAEYDSANNRVRFRLGVGANATSGGLIPPTQGATVRFRVQVLPSAAGQTLTNTAQISYNSQTLGTSFSQSASVSVSSTVVGYTLSGFVYHDLQPNSVRDGGEDWSSGVTVYVKLLQGGSMVQVTTVNPGTGAYSFPNLAPGSYTLIVDDNNNPADTTPNPPSSWHFIHPTGGVRSLTLNSNLTGQDFGLFRGTRLSGRVFYDDGEGGGIPNNALQDGTERGGGGVTLAATDGTNTRTATTDGNGNYLLWIPYAWGSVTLSHPARPATGWNDGSAATPVTSWSAATSPTSSGAVVSLGAASGLPANLTRNFGLVRHSTFRPDQSGQATSPGVLTYAHLFQPGTLGNVALSLAGAPSFAYQARFDANCNGSWDPGESFTPLPLSFTVGAAWPREADGSLKACALEVQVVVPAGVPDGRVDMATLQASLQWTNNASVVESRSLVDATTVAMGTLRLTKEVRNVTQGTPFAASAGGRPLEVLEYRIAYQNIGSQPIFNVVLFDPIPFFTDLVQNAYGGGGEVALVCPNGTTVYPDLGLTSTISLNLAAYCALNTAPHPDGTGPAPALLPGEEGYFFYRVQVR